MANEFFKQVIHRSGVSPDLSLGNQYRKEEKDKYEF